MLEERYPSESWIRVHTDGSATNTTTKGGAGIYIQYPNGEQQSEAIPTSLHCSNYKTEGEAISTASHTIKCKVHNAIQVVFLTDAISVLQALMNDNLPQHEQELYTIKTLCGVHGNEQVDRLATHGAGQQQPENLVCLTEMKTIIKSLFKTPQ
jgi:ribonuclease HI